MYICTFGFGFDIRPKVRCSSGQIFGFGLKSKTYLRSFTATIRYWTKLLLSNFHAKMKFKVSDFCSFCWISYLFFFQFISKTKTFGCHLVYINWFLVDCWSNETDICTFYSKIKSPLNSYTLWAHPRFSFGNWNFYYFLF